MPASKEMIINFGTSHVSASIFSYENDEVQLLKFAHHDIIQNTGNEEAWIAAITDALQELCRAHKLKGLANLILPGSQLLSKTLRVPKVEQAKQRKIVSYELGQKMPFPLSEMVWDFQVIDDDGIEQEILAYAVKPQLINSICKVIYDCGLIPVHICPGALLDYEVLVRSQKLKDFSEKVLINVGAKSTSLLFANPTGYLVRTINVGGNALTESIAENFGLPFEKAEELKINFNKNLLNLSTSDPASPILETAKHNYFNKIGQEISRSIVTYKRLKKGKSPQAIMASGNPTNDATLINFLSESQQLPVFAFDPAELLSISEDGVMESDLEKLPYVISEPLGFAFLIFEKKSSLASINLLPESIVRELRFKKKRIWLVLSMLIFACSPLPSLIKLSEEEAQLNRQSDTFTKALRAKEQELSQIHSKKALLSIYQDVNLRSSKFVNSLNRLHTQIYSQTRLINSIQDVTQFGEIENLWIDSITYADHAEGKTSLSGSFNNQEESLIAIKISGRYLVKIEDIPQLDQESQRNRLIDQNSIIQESLTDGISKIPQVIKLSKKVFSTEGKGDLFNRFFTHFDLEILIDTSK